MFSEPAQPYTILDEMFFISSITVYQQAGLAGTKVPASNSPGYPLCQTILVGARPKPQLNAEVLSAAARSCER